jgi:hypothetical protein
VFAACRRICMLSQRELFQRNRYYVLVAGWNSQPFQEHVTEARVSDQLVSSHSRLYLLIVLVFFFKMLDE